MLEGHRGKNLEGVVTRFLGIRRGPDREDIAAQLRQFGAPGHVLKGWEADADDDQDGDTIIVLEPNWTAFEVWRRCRPVMVATMTAIVMAGIEAVEIEAVCRAVGVPFDADVLDKVHRAASIADRIRNDR